MVTYQPVVATLNAQVHQETWTQAGAARGRVDQWSVRDSTHRIAIETDDIPVAAFVIGANHHDVGQRLPLLDTPPAMRGLRGRLLQKPQVFYDGRSDDSDPRRQHLRARGIDPVMARRRAESGSGLGHCQIGKIWPARNPRQKSSV